MCNFANEITKSNIINKLDKNLFSDPNSNYNILIEEMDMANVKHMPYKIVTFNKRKHKKPAWITKGILRSIKYRDNLYTFMKMTNPNAKGYFVQKINLRTYNCILRRSIRAAKLIYYEILFNKYRNNTRKTWKTINDILSRPSKKKTLQKTFREGDFKITNNVEIANKFNSFFTNIGPCLARKIQNISSKCYSSYLKRHLVNPFKFHEINEETIIKIIDTFPAKTSCGYDGISLKQLKYIKCIIIESLTLIVRQILNTGIFPDKLKIAKVIPIFKNDDDTQFCNYRPISLLPVISKVIEKVMHNQIYSFFTEHRLFLCKPVWLQNRSINRICSFGSTR